MIKDKQDISEKCGIYGQINESVTCLVSECLKLIKKGYTYWYGSMQR